MQGWATNQSELFAHYQDYITGCSLFCENVFSDCLPPFKFTLLELNVLLKTDCHDECG